jgi:hypothetical protein
MAPTIKQIGSAGVIAVGMNSDTRMHFFAPYVKAMKPRQSNLGADRYALQLADETRTNLPATSGKVVSDGVLDDLQQLGPTALAGNTQVVQKLNYE